MKQSTKETIVVLILVIICCMGGKAQDKKALLEYNQTTKKVYLHDIKTNLHHEVFQDTLNGEVSKFYILEYGKKNYAVFRRTPKTLIFDYIYGTPPIQLQDYISKQ